MKYDAIIDFGRRVTYNLEFEVELRDDTMNVEVTAMFIWEDDFDDEGCPMNYDYLFEFRLFAYDEEKQNYERDVTGSLTDAENRYLQRQIDEWAADAAAAAAEAKAER